MKRLIQVISLALFAGALVAASPAFATEATLKTDDDIVSAIQANTPEKHQEIAAWYKARAADEKKQAEEHKKMAHAYMGSKATYADQMHKHCDMLVTLHEKTALQYEKLAKEHEAAAGVTK